MSTACYAKQCQLDPADGCIAYGKALVRGRGVDSAPERGVALLNDHCDRRAEYDIGTYGCEALADLYAEGVGVSRDDARAFQLYQYACTGNSDVACTAVGRAYKYGRGVEPNRDKAIELLREACAWEIEACDELVPLEMNQDGSIGAGKQAIAALTAACDAGIRIACKSLAHRYSKGIDVPKSPELAQQLLEKWRGR